MHWIIGDIHGMYPPLLTVLEAIEKRDADARLIFCGDYINRGPDSFRVMEHLLKLTNARFCRGNHDDAMDLLLSGECFVNYGLVSDVVASFSHFIKYGLDQTLVSYGVSPRQIAEVKRRPSVEKIKSLLESVPASHRDFYHNLPVLQFEKRFFVAHAKWDITESSGIPGFATQISNSQKLRHDLIWGRFSLHEIAEKKRWSRTGFFGHTPVTVYYRSEPILPLKGTKMVLLDTAAAVHANGRLTAWCVEEERFIQSDRDGALV